MIPIEKVQDIIAKHDNLEKEIYEITNGNGVDGVIIATATKSNQPCVDAIKITRSKGRIVVVGTAGMSVDRDMLFKKEISMEKLCLDYGGR